MKRIKNKILISAIAGLSSLAAIVAPLSTTISTNTTSVLNSGLTATKYVEVTFNTDTDVTLQGITKVKVKENHVFSTVNKPKAIHAKNYDFLGWSTTKGDKTKIVTDTTKMVSTTTWSLYPIFASPGIVIEGDDVILSSKPTTFKAYVHSASQANIKWDIKPDAGFSGDVEMGKDTGVVKSSALATGTAVITAEDTLSGEKQTKSVKFDYPFANSTSVWAYVGDEPNDKWLELDMDDLITKDELPPEEIHFKDITGGSQKIARSFFDKATICVGTEITSIPDNFMNSWDSFDGFFAFNSTYTQSKCVMIGKWFLQNCKKFTNGNDIFMLDSTQIKVIDDGFLYGCEGLTHTVLLPPNLTYIGNDFMNGCIKYQHGITIPASVTRVGTDFMANTPMLGYDNTIITIDCDPEVFEVVSSPYSLTLTTNDSSKSAFANGVQIKCTTNGTYDEDKTIEFLSRFPNRENTTGSETPYRKLIPYKESQKDFTACEWSDVIKWCELLEKGEINETQFAYHYGKASMDDLVGLTRTLQINGLGHTVRVIGTQHDTITDGEYEGKKAALTFELSTVLSSPDQSNFAYFCYSSDADNKNYLNSIVRKNLNSTATDPALWRNASGEQLSDKRSAIQMLTNTTTGSPAVADAIKETKHYVATTTNTWSDGVTADTEYSDKLFIPSYYNYTQTKSSYCLETKNTTYSYYKRSIVNIYQKQDLAGWNRHYWFSSPYTNNTNDSFVAYNSNPYSIFHVKYDYSGIAVAFAFCI